MFSETSVTHSVHRQGGLPTSAYQGVCLLGGLPTRGSAYSGSRESAYWGDLPHGDHLVAATPVVGTYHTGMHSG